MKAGLVAGFFILMNLPGMKKLPLHLLGALASGLLLASCSGSQKLAKKPAQDAPRIEHELLAENTVPAPDKAPEADYKESSLLEDYVDEWLGTPHSMGGTTKEGVDCSGFVICVYRDVYGDTFSYRRSCDLQKETTRIGIEELQQGDLVFFKIHSRVVNHVGVYLGDGYFAHASLSSGITISSLSEDYYARYFYCGGRKTSRIH